MNRRQAMLDDGGDTFSQLFKVRPEEVRPGLSQPVVVAEQAVDLKLGRILCSSTTRQAERGSKSHPRLHEVL